MPSKYELVCGLEVHAELNTASKMFCGCKNDPFGAEKPNIHTCPVCLGLPGALPVANKKAIEWTIQLGLALGCKINLFSKFDRKHYFYPDLPKGYQISQYDIPFCYEGLVETEEGPVRITRIHLEEDTGKLQHTTLAGKKVSLIDFNRSGVPLIEVVTEPDITSAAQAKAYAKKLRQIIKFIGIANCDMEQGGMRLEANVSVRPVGATELPDYKVELKNINSFKFLEQAINYEIERQSAALENGETLTQQTRGWDSVANKSTLQREKESAADYRYFPDPDLPPIRFSEEQLAELRSKLPELPTEISARWQSTFGVEARFSLLLIEDQATTSIYEELFTEAQKKSLDTAKLAGHVVNKRIPSPIETSVGETLEAFVAQFATTEIAPDALEPVIAKILDANPDVVAKYKAGQQQVLGFMMGQILRELGAQKPDPAQIRDALHKQLSTR